MVCSMIRSWVTGGCGLLQTQPVEGSGELGSTELGICNVLWDAAQLQLGQTHPRFSQMMVEGLGAVVVVQVRWSWCCMVLLATICACRVLHSCWAEDTGACSQQGACRDRLLVADLSDQRPGRIQPLSMAAWCATYELQGKDGAGLLPMTSPAMQAAAAPP